MSGRRDERGWEEVAKEGPGTRCCQTGTLILAPLPISSVTEGKSLNPQASASTSGAQRQVLFMAPADYESTAVMLHSRQQGQAVQKAR